MTQQQLHELYVWKLSKELKKEYDDVRTNVFLEKRERTVGEIDVLAFKDGEVHVFEVKTSYRPTKVRQQLRKIRRHYEEEISKFFFYCASADNLEEVAVE